MSRNATKNTTQIETGIYWIENLKTGDCYVGQTARSFQVRDGEHDSDMVNRLHSNSKLQRAFNKYGRKAFKFRVLERATGNLDRLEDKWILKKNAFYNVTWSDGTLIERDADGNIIPRKSDRGEGLDFLSIVLMGAIVIIALDMLRP